jgi:hypothetical protein
MSNETTQNFWSVLRHFEWPEPEPVIYRLYHDDQGRPLFYSMEKLPGTYIEVDQATYVRASYQVRVRDGRMMVLQPLIQVSKLDPHDDLGVPCHTQDVCVIVRPDQSHQKWRKITNEID